MKNNNIYSFEVVDHVPRFGHVIHYLKQHFAIADILSIGDVVIADEGQDRVEEICDYLDLNKAVDPSNDVTNWDPTIFDADTYWQVLKELDSLIVYCFETKAGNRFRKFTDYGVCCTNIFK
ncbi:MAG: hypothetical protein HZA15_06765 [Nitrospirae bacterium]|nr:hypothetical protein [Nitrospirota bacterium]